LVRRRRGGSSEGGLLDQYVNDRPYAASSFLSVAIAEVFGSALSGSSKDRPELVNVALPLTVEIPVVPCRGGEVLLRRLFEPLGYRVECERLTLDRTFPEWGESPYQRVKLEGTHPLNVLLSHLYVLLPVLDNDKHYWVGDDEVQKLLRHGEGWLPGHPEKETITKRYLKFQRSLFSEALAQLADEGDPTPDATTETYAQQEADIERSLSLNDQRIASVLAALISTGGQSVLDLGCGEGRLLKLLLKERQFHKVVGMDVSHQALENAAENLNFERLPTTLKEKLQLLHGSLMYRDKRLAGFDAAAVVEVIEHLDPPRLSAFERVLFEFAQPRHVVLTTPNREYNVKWPSLPAGTFRHRDHRFEWTRQEFQSWATGIAQRFAYSVKFLPIGPEDSLVGSPTQMAVFSK